MNIREVIYVIRKINWKNKDLYSSKIIRNVTKGAKPILFRFLKKKFNPENVFVVYSEARGGSTWIMEVLQESLNGITFFEPLSGKNKKKDFTFRSPFYFTDKKYEEAVQRFLTETFSGNVSGKRMLQINSISDICFGQNMIVKMVNVNLIAPWFVKTFELRYKPIYVLRHPLAILASREKYGLFGEKPEGNKDLGPYSRNILRCEYHPYEEYLEELDRADNKYCRYITEWCIRNKDFLNGSYNEDFHVIFYEDMVLQPDQVLKDLAATWGIDFKEINTNIESGTTDVGSKVYQGQKQLSKWCQFFTEEEKRMMQVVLDRFDVKLYSAFSPNIFRD